MALYDEVEKRKRLAAALQEARKILRQLKTLPTLQSIIDSALADEKTETLEDRNELACDAITKAEGGRTEAR